MVVNMQLSRNEFEHATDVFTDELLFRAANGTDLLIFSDIVIVVNLRKRLQTHLSISTLLLPDSRLVLVCFLLGFGIACSCASMRWQPSRSRG